MKVDAGRPRSLGRLCGLFGYSRQAYYKHFREGEEEAYRADLIVKEVVEIRKDMKRIGGKKLHFMLEDFMAGLGKVMGRDAFFDLLRDNALLVRKRRARKPRTTFSGLWMKKYPNLAKGFVPTGPNQLWVSDITYIRMAEGFSYLSLITDAYSHKVVGWCLRKDLSSKGCIAALKMAKKDNSTKNLIHHSDRGLQYYSSAYRKMLGKGVSISMSEKSDPLENAVAERMNGILKQEFLEPQLFLNFKEAETAVERSVYLYNYHRPHSSIENLTPGQAHQMARPLKRLWKTYYKKYQNNQQEACVLDQTAAAAAA